MTCYALVGAESADRHADALLRLPEACVAAVVDADGGRRGPAARRLGAGLQAATVAELLAAHPDCCSGVLVHGAPTRGSMMLRQPRGMASTCCWSCRRQPAPTGWRRSATSAPPPVCA